MGWRKLATFRHGFPPADIAHGFQRTGPKCQKHRWASPREAEDAKDVSQIKPPSKYIIYKSTVLPFDLHPKGKKIFTEHLPCATYYMRFDG